MPITPPHGMFNIPDDDPAWQIYKDESWPEDARRYAAMVSMVDRQLGELFALLKELDPDGDGPLTRPRTQTRYDVVGRVAETIEFAGTALDYAQQRAISDRRSDDTRPRCMGEMGSDLQ